MENGRIDYKVVLDTSAMQAEANKVTQSFQNMASAAQSEGAKIDNAFSTVAGNIGKAFAALGAAATFQQLTQKILQVRGEFQQLEVAFETMLGSAQQADALMSQLVSTAATTPFGLQEVAGGAKQLLAYGTAAEEVNDTLVRLGDIAAGLSIPLGDLVYLYGTTQTQGRLYTQDLRQFMGRGIPLVEELAKQFGVAKEEVGELVTQGKVGFPEVKKAIQSMTGEGSKFGGLMEKQSHTITGQISNIEDALDMMFNDLGKSSEGVINDVLSGISFVIEHYETFGKILLTIIAAYGEYKAALMVVSAYQSMIAGQEAAIAATKEAALTQAIANANADTAATEANTLAKQANMSAIDMQVAATLRSLQSKQFEAEVTAQNAALELSNAQRRATASESLLAQRQAEYMAAVRSGEMSQITAARTNLETAATERQNAVLALNVAQEKAQETTKAAAAAQQKVATFQTEVDTAAKTANSTATGVWAAVTNTATVAVKGLTAAMASNPIGMVLVAITAVIGVMSLFSSSTDEATNSVDRFKQAVAGEENELQSYLMALQVLDKNSQTYKDVLQKVVDIGAKHGKTLEIENGQIKDQTKAIEDLTKALRREAAQKALAEQAAKTNEKAMESEKDAMEDLISEAKDAYESVRTGEHDSTKIALEKIREITTATWSMISMDVMAHAQEIADAFAEGSEAGEEAIQKQVERIETYLQKMGVGQHEIEVFHEKIVDYVTETANGFSEAYGEMSRTEAQLQGLTGQTLDLSDANASLDENVSDGLRNMHNEFGNIEGDIVALTLAEDEVLNRIDGINNSTMDPQIKTNSVEFLRDILIEIQGLLGDVTQGSLKSLRAQEKALKDQLESLAPDDPKVAPLRKQLQAIQRGIKTTTEQIYGSSGSGGHGGRGHTGSRGSSHSRSHSSRSSSRDRKPDPLDIQYEVDQAEKSYREKLQDLIDDLVEDISDGVTAAMADGNEKIIQQIKDDTQDQLDALDEQVERLEEANRENKRKIWKEQHPNAKDREYTEPTPQSVDEFLNSEGNEELAAAYKKRREQIIAEGAKAEKEARKKYAEDETTAMQEYLIEYGSFSQKKAAIAAKYNKEIADATTIGEKLALTRAMQDALAAVDMEALKEEINWEAVFSDLDRVSIDALNKLKERLRQALQDKNITADNAKVIAEQIDKINEQLTKRQSGWREAFGLVIPALEEQKRLIKEAEEAQRRLNDAQKEHELITDQVKKDQKAITDFIVSQGKSYSGDVNTGNAADILKLFEGDSKATNTITGLIGNLAKSEGSLAQSTSKLGSATEAAGQAAEAAGGSAAGTIAMIDTIVHGINDNIQSTKELVEQLGFSDTKFGKGFSAFAESSQYATEAWESLKSGNIMGVANGVVGSLRTLGDALGEWGIGFFGSSDKTLVKDIERLTRSNESLEGAVSRLTKTMEQQAGSDLTKTYTEAVDDLEIAMANTQEMIARSAAAYSNGFFGIGGKGSTNKKIAKLLSTSDWERISQIMGRTITDVSQIWEMSSEEMGKLLEHAPDIWAKFKEGASDGYKDISDYLDSYVELYDKLIDLQQQYNESITQTSFDNIKSGLADLINDTETNAYDVIGNVTTMLQNSILNIVLTKSMKPKLDKWYEDFANSMADDTLTAMEHAALEEGYADIYKQAKEEVDRAYKLAGIDPNTGDVEDASTGAWSALGEETGRSLDGRMTAIHIQVTKIADMMLLDHEAIGRMDMRSMQDSTTLNEMHNLIFLSTEHLERVARNSDALPQINSKLEQIRQNTDRL